jgi:ribosomal protein S14
MTIRSGHENAEHGRLLQSVFMFIATCIRNRANRTVNGLDLRADQTERIARLTATDLVTVGELAGRCVTFDIDPEALDNVFRALDDRRHRDELIERCIRRGASRGMMQAFFGLSRHRYSRARAILGLPRTRGRVPCPTEALEERIYALWTASGGRWSPESLLNLADTLDISLRTVWDRLKGFRP